MQRGLPDQLVPLVLLVELGKLDRLGQPVPLEMLGRLEVLVLLAASDQQVLPVHQVFKVQQDQQERLVLRVISDPLERQVLPDKLDQREVQALLVRLDKLDRQVRLEQQVRLEVSGQQVVLAQPEE